MSTSWKQEKIIFNALPNYLLKKKQPKCFKEERARKQRKEQKKEGKEILTEVGKDEIGKCRERVKRSIERGGGRRGDGGREKELRLTGNLENCMQSYVL